ncbi:MAG: hypothetical protein QXG97_06500 [Nitrososphaerota archaeon]|nr:glycosyltransferase [Candidatus Bathyarchaeota archaeon]
MTVKKPFVVACIPAYNEERAIAKVVVQARKYVGKVLEETLWLGNNN